MRNPGIRTPGIEDMFSALGRAAGFSLDEIAGMFTPEGEPKIDPRYRSLENVFLLPHIGSATVRTRLAMCETAGAVLN